MKAEDRCTVILDVAGQRVRLVGQDGDEKATEGIDTVDDADAWVAAVERLGAHLHAAVAIRATAVGLVCLDIDRRAVHPVVWAHDDRSAPDAAWCRKKYDDEWWRSEIGTVPETHHLVTKLSWLHRSDPDIWARTRFMGSLEDHLRGSLTRGPMTTREDLVEEYGLWGQGEYRGSILALIDVDRQWSGVLPQVRAAGAVLGTWRGVEVVL